MLGCLIIARLSSTRLPNKNILTLNDIPMIINLFNRIKKSIEMNNQIGLFSRVHPNTHSNTIVVRNGFAWAVRIATLCLDG